MKTLNKQVAVTPFVKENTQDRPRARGLDLTDVTVTKLIEAEVLYDSDNFSKGDTLYFRSDILRMPQVSQKLKLGETTFILLQEDFAIFVKRSGNGQRPEALPPSSNGQA